MSRHVQKELASIIRKLQRLVTEVQNDGTSVKAPETVKLEGIPDFEWPCCLKCGEPVQVFAEDFREWCASCSALPDHTGYVKGADPISALRNFALKNTPPEKDEE